MLRHRLVSTALIGSLALAPVGFMSGCENLPGGAKEQGAVIGGAGGAAAGAAVAGDDDRLLGALIGGVLGAGGGYLIGAQKEKLDNEDDRDEIREEARRADERATQSPATARDVERARTADINDDGFVTLDEVIAMREANLSDREMIDRLEDTGQIFELTASQERQLEDEGVSREVILAMRDLNRDGDDDFARTASDRDRDEDLDRYDRDDERVGSY